MSAKHTPRLVPPGGHRQPRPYWAAQEAEPEQFTLRRARPVLPWDVWFLAAAAGFLLVVMVWGALGAPGLMR